ncbi:MAG: hypothetical protein ACRENC_07205 [Gemmatimonadaceae bacterium]
MYQSVLTDVRLFELLWRIDQDLARVVQAKGCGRCGGRLDRADYARKPRGVPPNLSTEHAVRLSLCCAAEGCRRRSTPPSARFLGRRVYVGAAIMGITALQPGARCRDARALREWLGVSARTLARWRRWWRDVFATSAFWCNARGQLRTPIPARALPGALLRRFAGDLQTQLIAGLRFLAPITTAAGVM